MKSLNPVGPVKEAMRQCLKESNFSRDQVVDAMNELARLEGLTTNGKAQKISTDILDKWVSQSCEHIIPWKLFPIFCKVVGDIAPLRFLVASLGVELIDQDESNLLKWARAEMESRRLRRIKRKLETEIGL
jgi:hypothetical protein